MAWRALIIGSEIVGLTGVTQDLDIIGALLTARGFEVRRHEKDTATRDAVVAALTDLAVDTAPGDAAVVYYSGHGGRVLDDGDPQPGIPRVAQFIAPYDFTESTAGDFRGITALEMSAHLAALSVRTRNVSVILDCCYSSRMARDLQLVPRAIPQLSYVDIAAHLERLGGARLTAGIPDIESNPDVVRLVAAGPEQQAFEYPGPGGKQVGLLTQGLSTILAEAADTPVIWSDLARSLRGWVQTLAPSQRPEAEGPAGRVLFTTDEPDRAGILTGTAGPGGVTLDGGQLAGVGVGDVYVALDPARPDPATPLAHLTVRSVTATSALAAALMAGATALPASVEARPVARAGRRMSVAVHGDGPGADPLAALLAASRHVAPADTPAADVLPAFTVELTAAGATVLDGGGPLTDPVPADDAGLATVVANLDRLARAAALRGLDPGAPDILAASAVEWGTVDGGTPQPLSWSGAVLFPGDRIWVRLRNTGPSRLWFFVFSVGGGGTVGLVTNADPSGIALDRDEEWLVGMRPEVSVTPGLPVSWPDGVPDAGRPITESLVVIATTQRQTLSLLEQRGITRGDFTALQAVFAQIADGRTRGVPGETDPSAVRYAAHHLVYQLTPTARPAVDGGKFLLDERPDLSVSVLAPRSLTAAPEKVAIRLAELVVQRNRAWGSADLRLDALVVTGPARRGGPPAHTAGTWRFPRVRDGDRLSFDNLLLAHGPARDYLDIAVWLSRERDRALDLATLVDEKLNAAGFVQAAGALAVAVPPLAAAVASLGAVGSLVDLAYRALAAVVGDSVGVYRTSFLAGEGFGVGQHPAGGLRSEQGMSFRYRIEAV